MTLQKTLTERYTTKEYDTNKHLSQDTVEKLLLSLKYAPSSLNLQPWHFFIASHEKSRVLIGKATSGMHAYNLPRVENASHVVVLCAKKSISEAYLKEILHQEESDKRVTTQEGAQKMSGARKAYINMHKKIGDVTIWNEKQVYLALGFLLFAAASEKIDATPIEGFDAEILSKELHLDEKGLVPCVIVSLGHHASTDWNKTKPKSRLKENKIFTWI